jgi:hypothetical protein
MLLHHLRRNAVAYLALVIALSTGTAYAAGQLANGSVTTKKLAKNAVTSPKIKMNAVRSDDIKNGSVTQADLAAGVLPAGVAISGQTLGDNPVASPDLPAAAQRSVSLSAPGTVYLRWSGSNVGLDCGDGLNREIGLYLDGSPLPGTRLGVSGAGQPRHRELVWSGHLGAGAHTVRVGLNCGTDVVTGEPEIDEQTWTVLVQPD